MIDSLRDNDAGDSGDPVVSRSSRRAPSRLALIAGALIVVILAAIWLPGRGAPAQGAEEAALNWAEVVRTDLVQQRTFSALLKSVDEGAVITQRAGTLTQIAVGGDTIRQGESFFAINNRPVVLLYGELAAYRDIAIGEERYTPWSPLSGKLTWVPKEGAVIEQGQVLYRVDDRPVVLLYGAQPGYRTLGLAGSNPQDQASLAAARAALLSAQAQLTALTTPATAQQIVAAEQFLASARLAAEELLEVSEADALDISAARHSLEQAKNGLWAAQIQRDAVCGGKEGSQTGCDAATAAVQSSQESVYIAEISLQKLTNPPSTREIADAQGQVAQAEANLAALLQPPDPDLVAAAEEQVIQSQAALDALLNEMAPSGPGYDVRQLESALVALGFDLQDRVTVDAVFDQETMAMVKRWQASVGATVDGIVNAGEVVFLPGPAQVLERLVMPGGYAGGSVLCVSSGVAAHGADVRQLEEALLALGYDAAGTLLADGEMDAATIAALVAWQGAVGQEADGIVNLGDVVFMSGAARVTAALRAVGNSVSVGSEVLNASLSEKVVQMWLPANDQAMVAVGDTVVVELPDETEVPATVILRSNTATPQDNGSAAFDVRIALDDPIVARELDWAPVTVHVVADSVEQVLAVPVSALVALLEGGYAVEIEAGRGETQYVGVEVGFFGSNNMIEIRSPQIEIGDRVVVP